MVKAKNRQYMTSDGCLQGGGLKNVPVVHAVIYGNREEAAKLQKRVACASRRFHISWQFKTQTDPFEAIDFGIIRQPSLVIDGRVVVEGLSATEEIENVLESYFDN